MPIPQYVGATGAKHIARLLFSGLIRRRIFKTFRQQSECLFKLFRYYLRKGWGSDDLLGRSATGLGLRDRWRSSFQSLAVRGRHQAAAPVPVPEAQVEVGGLRALPERESAAGLRLGTTECAEAQFRGSERIVLNESRVREIRTLGSTSGEETRVKVQTEAPALWRTPSATATPSTLDKCASPRFRRSWGAASRAPLH